MHVYQSITAKWLKLMYNEFFGLLLIGILEER